MNLMLPSIFRLLLALCSSSSTLSAPSFLSNANTEWLNVAKQSNCCYVLKGWQSNRQYNYSSIAVIKTHGVSKRPIITYLVIPLKQVLLARRSISWKKVCERSPSKIESTIIRRYRDVHNETSANTCFVFQHSLDGINWVKLKLSQIFS